MATIGDAETSSPAAAGGAPRIGSDISLTGLLATIFRSARDVFLHTLEVAALESRLAGVTLATIAGVALAVLVLLLSTWGLLLAAGVRGLMELGLGPGAALLIAAAVNLILAVLLGLIVPRLARRMTFSATRRVLGKIGSDG